MADDRIELKLEIDGEEQISDLAAAAILASGQLEKLATAATTVEKATKKQIVAVVETTAETYDLADAYEVLGALSTSVFTSAQQIGQAMKAEATALGSVEVAAAKASKSVNKVDDANKKTKKSAESMGGGFLELSRAVEDAQYGLNGVLNNLPTMVQRFGGPSGLAAAVSLTAVAIYSLRGKFAELSAYLNGEQFATAADSVATVKKRLDELTDKPHKLDIDYSRLDEARKLLDVMEKKLAGFKSIADQTTVQEKSGKAVSELIKEEAGGTDEQSGKENLAKAVVASGAVDPDEAIQTSKSNKAKLIRDAAGRAQAARGDQAGITRGRRGDRRPDQRGQRESGQAQA